jgi:hypothetical protein
MLLLRLQHLFSKRLSKAEATFFQFSSIMIYQFAILFLMDSALSAPFSKNAVLLSTLAASTQAFTLLPSTITATYFFKISYTSPWAEIDALDKWESIGVTLDRTAPWFDKDGAPRRPTKDLRIS